MNEILLRDLDNYSADERKHIICEEYTQIYKHEYMPIVLKNSKPEDRQYNEKKLLAELNETYTNGFVAQRFHNYMDFKGFDYFLIQN